MRKTLSMLLMMVMLAMCAFGFSGCSVNSKPLGADEEAVLRLFAGGSQWTGAYAESLEAFVAEYKAGGFNNARERFKADIELELATDIETTYVPKLKNEQKYPHLFLFDRFNTPTYAKNNFILDISDKVEAAKIDTGAFASEALKELTYNDNIYGLPTDLDVWGIYVNLDMVTAYNSTAAEAEKIVLNDNWTWDEMFAIAQKLKTNDVGGYSINDLEQHFFKYMISTGTPFLTEDFTPNVKTGAGEEVLKFFKKMKDANLSKDNIEDISFPTGKVAMINKSTYYGAYVKKMKPTLNYRFMPQPRFSVDGVVREGAVNGGMIGGFGLVIPNPDKKLRNARFESYADRAFNVLEWWTIGEGAAEWAKYSSTLPALAELHSDEFVQGNKEIKAASTFYQNYKIRNQVPGFQNYQIYVVNSAVRDFLNKPLSSSSITKALDELSSKKQFEL